jgi:hypothetical protein
VSTAAEAATFVTKSMSYEKTPPASYVEEVCHLAEVLFPDTWQYGVDPPEDITLDGKDLTEDIDAEIDPTWERFNHFQSDSTLDRAQALAALNAGHHLTTLMCHGDAFKFSVGNGLNPHVYIADADVLTNGNHQLVVMATACNPNQFDLESVGESLLNNPNGGAVVCIGPTRVDFPLSATSSGSRRTSPGSAPPRRSIAFRSRRSPPRTRRRIAGPCSRRCSSATPRSASGRSSRRRSPWGTLPPCRSAPPRSP